MQCEAGESPFQDGCDARCGASRCRRFDSLRDIIWFIDPTHDKLSDLVARLEMITRQMLPTVPHTFERVTASFVHPGLPMTFRRNAPPLFKETLHNLLRHSRATQAAITVGCTARQFNFQVQDNGVGFDPQAKSSGNGLKNMNRRALEMGGPGKSRVRPAAAPRNPHRPLP